MTAYNRINMEPFKNVVKIAGDKNHVLQDSESSSKADIKGNKNNVCQGNSPAMSPNKVSKWTKVHIFFFIVFGALTLLFTYIIYKDKINSWFSNLF